jgi:hypothetical protein
MIQRLLSDSKVKILCNAVFQCSNGNFSSDGWSPCRYEFYRESMQALISHNILSELFASGKIYSEHKFGLQSN